MSSSRIPSLTYVTADRASMDRRDRKACEAVEQREC